MKADERRESRHFHLALSDCFLLSKEQMVDPMLECRRLEQDARF